MTDAQIEQYLHGKKWSDEEFDRLTSLFPDQRYELIEGDLIDKMGQGPAHIRILIRLTTLLTAAFPNRVSIQSDIAVPVHESARYRPQPDAVVLKKSVEDLSGIPAPDDIALIIEVADTTLATDLDTKSRLYSRCGIPEYWVVDVKNQRVIEFRSPGQTHYADKNSYGIDNIVIAVDGMLQLPVAHLFERKTAATD